MTTPRAQRLDYRRLVRGIKQGVSKVALGVGFTWQPKYTKKISACVGTLFESKDRSAAQRELRAIRQRHPNASIRTWTYYYMSHLDTGRIAQVYPNTSEFTENYECGQGVRLMVNRGPVFIGTLVVPLGVDAELAKARVAHAIVYGTKRP